jgi:hypothetical protein
MKFEIEPKSKKSAKKLVEFLKKKDISFSIIDNTIDNKPDIVKRKKIDVRIKKNGKKLE